LGDLRDLIRQERGDGVAADGSATVLKPRPEFAKAARKRVAETRERDAQRLSMSACGGEKDRT
jgi:hypothetical protein